MNFGERVYNYRIKNNLTQKEFGKLIRLHEANVSRVENGTYKPSKRMLAKMEMLEKEV